MKENHHHEQALASAVDQALKALPELSAPATLAPRVLAALARRAASPWYRQSWEHWPVALQATVLILLIGVLGGVYYGASSLPRAEMYGVIQSQVASWLGLLGSLANALVVVVSAMISNLKQLGATVLIAGALVIAYGYAPCAGIGAACLKLAQQRR